MKKLLTILLAVLLVLGMTACTKKPEPEPDTPATPAMTKAEALADYRVRRALQLGIDRSKIVEALDAGDVYYELYGYVPKGFAGVNGDFREEVDKASPYVYTDKETAKALLAECGFDANNPLQLEYYYNQNAMHDTVAAVLKSELKEINVDLTLKTADVRTFFDDRDSQGNFDLARGAMSADFMDVATFLDMAKTSNQQGAITWGDASYDKMMDDSLLMTGTDRLSFLHDAEKYLVETTAQVIPLFAYNTLLLVKPGVTGYIGSPQANEVFWYVTNPGSTTFKYALGGEPSPLDPSYATDSVSAYVMNQLYAPLFIITPDGSMANASCESYTVSEDGLVYTFKLVKNGWSDGKPVTADDFVYGIKRSLGMGEADSYYSYFIADFVLNAKEHRGDDVANMDDVGVKALDDDTLEITLGSPCPYFVSLLSMGVFYPARPDFAPEHDYTWGSNPNNPSNGAFYTTKVDLADEVVMAKNPYFFDAANVSIETMTAKVMEDMDAQFMAFQTGEIDFATSVSSDALKTFPADSEEMVVNQSVINYYVLINEYQK